MVGAKRRQERRFARGADSPSLIGAAYESRAGKGRKRRQERWIRAAQDSPSLPMFCGPLFRARNHDRDMVSGARRAHRPRRGFKPFSVGKREDVLPGAVNPRRSRKPVADVVLWHAATRLWGEECDRSALDGASGARMAALPGRMSFRCVDEASSRESAMGSLGPGLGALGSGAFGAGMSVERRGVGRSAEARTRALRPTGIWLHPRTRRPCCVAPSPFSQRIHV